MKISRISDFDHPLLTPYRNLKESNSARWSTGFITEGKLVVERLLESRLEIFSLLISEKRLGHFIGRVTRDVEALVVPHDLVSDLVGFDFHAGILAYGKRPDLSIEFKRLSKHAANHPHMTIVACPITTLPDNLGSIIQLSAAFGVDGLLVSPQSADPYSRRCVRVSMGNIFRLPIVETPHLPDVLSELKKLGFQIIACHQHLGSNDVRHFSWPSKIVLMVGNEATGIPEALLKTCDQHLEIPITSGVDSLNVSTAVAIFLYERSRSLADGRF